MSEPQRVEKIDMKNLADMSSSSSNSNLKSEIYHHLFSEIGNKPHTNSATGPIKPKKILSSKEGESRENEFGQSSSENISKAEMLDGNVSEENKENESTNDDGGHDRSSEASEDEEVNEDIGTGINFCTRDRIACRCAECMIRDRLNQANHGPAFNCAVNCRVCRHIQDADYEVFSFDVSLRFTNFPLAALEQMNNNGPYNKYHEPQHVIVLSFLAGITGSRTAALKSEVIAVDLIPKDASHDLVVYFRTDKYPEEFCAIWDDLSGENQDEGIHLMRSSETLVEYINERDGVIHGTYSDSSDSSADSDDGSSEYEPDEINEIADNLEGDLNVSDGSELDKEENYSGVIEAGNEDDGIMSGNYEENEAEPKTEEPKEDEMEIQFLGEMGSNEAGPSIGTDPNPNRCGTPTTFSSGRKRKSEPLMPMVEEDDDDIEIIAEVKKSKTSI